MKQRLVAFARFFLCQLLFPLICLGLFLHITFQLYHQQRKIREEAMERGRSEAVRAAHEFQRTLNLVEAANHRLVAELGRGPMDEAQIEAKIRKLHRDYPLLFGVGVAFLPGCYQPDRKLFAPLITRGEEGALQLAPITYDYTLGTPSNDWFNLTLAQGALWQEPHYGQASKTYLANYTAPLVRTDPSSGETTTVAVVFTSLSLDDYRKIMNGLRLGKTGYGYLFSGHGKMIFHPDEILVKNHTTVIEMARRYQSVPLEQAARAAMAGKPAQVPCVNELTGQSSWVFFEPIQGANWALAAVFFAKDLPDNQGRRFRSLIAAGLPLLAFLLYLGFRLPGWLHRDDPLVFASVWGSLWLLIALVALLFAARRTSFRGPSESVTLVDTAGMHRYLQNWASQSKLKEPPILIPTGVTLRTLSFQAAYDVMAAGQIWQKYPDGLEERVEPSWMFADALTESHTEIYRRRENGYLLIGWTFQVTLRQSFDYDLFPFDEKDVWLRLRHSEFYRNVLLVPDLDAYRLITPTSLPGIDTTIPIPGFERLSSFFEFQAISFKSGMGFQDFESHPLPELYFTLYLRRNSGNEVVIYFIPLIVISAMLFGLLLTTTSNDERNHLLAFNFHGLLAAASALFFTAILSHIELRRSLLGASLVYLEYFFLAIYLGILMVCANAYLVARKTEHLLVHYRDNLIPKLLFWPLLLGSLLALSLHVFCSAR